MAKTRPQIPLSRLSGGINRYLADNAPPDQAAEALDAVVDEGGDVHRRQAFRSVTHGPVHFLPSGHLTVATWDGAAGIPTLFVGGQPDYSAFQSGAVDLYLGGLSAFDGFDWGALITNSAGTPSSHKRLSLAYWNSGLAQWSTIPFFLDTTIHYRTGENYSESLGREGQVHWHPSHLSNWGSTTLATGALPARLWIRVRMVNMATGATTGPQQQWSLKAPGIRSFTREPLTSILPLVLDGTPYVLLGADRLDQPGKRVRASFSYANRNLEKGSALSVWNINGRSPSVLNITRRFASGIWGRKTDFPTAVLAGSAAGTAAAGTAGYLTDQCQGKEPPWTSPEQYSYLAEQVFGSDLVDQIQETSGASTGGFSTTDARLLNYPSGSLIGYYLRSTADVGGAGAIATDVVRKITNFVNGGSSVTFTVGDAYGGDVLPGTPNSFDRFSVVRPPSLIRILQSGRDYEPALSATQTQIPLEDTRLYAEHPSDALGSNAIVHFEVRDQLRYAQEAGRFYTMVVDAPHHRAVLCNGKGPLLEFDGKTLRKCRADLDSPAALIVAGSQQAVGPDGYAQGQTQPPENILRTEPPRGKIISRFAGRLCVADGTDLRFSQPLLPDIWATGDTYSIADPAHLPITGLASIYDRLIIFTAKSIFEATTDGTQISIRPTVIGTGWASHQAVAEVPLAQGPSLVGPIGSGIIGYANGNIFDVVQFWESILPGGINVARLDRAVTCHWRERNAVLFAVAQGSSDYNNRIVYWDYARNRFWLLSAPFGISSMAAITTSDGHEHILFGTDDGFLQTLVLADTDDSNTVTFSARTRPEQPFEAAEVNLRRLNFGISPGGQGGTVTYRVFLEESDTPWCSGSFPIDTGRATYGSGVYGTSVYAGETIKTHSVNLPNGTKAKKIQVEVQFTSPLLRLRQLWLEAAPLSTGRK